MTEAAERPPLVRHTTVEMDHQHPSGAVAVLDVLRLGVWVRFSVVIEEVRRGLCNDAQPMVTTLVAKDDDGKDVDVGQSEHDSVVMMFLQVYDRWRRRFRG